MSEEEDLIHFVNNIDFDSNDKVYDVIVELFEENNKLKQWDVNKDTRNSRQRIANSKLIKENKELQSRIDKAIRWLSRGELCIDIRMLVNDEGGCTTTKFVDDRELLSILKDD